jgi:transposase-like protein
MRRFAVEHAGTALAEGGSVSRAARELGVSEVTLAKWMQAAEDDDGASGFREVVVERPEVTACALTVVTPGGYRVEGLDLAGAAALLRAIA